MGRYHHWIPKTTGSALCLSSSSSLTVTLIFMLIVCLPDGGGEGGHLEEERGGKPQHDWGRNSTHWFVISKQLCAVIQCEVSWSYDKTHLLGKYFILLFTLPPTKLLLFCENKKCSLWPEG